MSFIINAVRSFRGGAGAQREWGFTGGKILRHGAMPNLNGGSCKIKKFSYLRALKLGLQIEE